MQYRKLRAGRSPVLFELQLVQGLASVAREGIGLSLPLPSRLRMRDYVESILLAEGLPPKTPYIAMLMQKFMEMVTFSESGRPFIYRKRHSVALLFDVCAVQSEMRLEAPDELVLSYTKAMMGFLLFHATPACIGMIGLGGGSLPKYCYHHLPQTSLIVAENDPQVIALRDHFQVPADDDRFAIVCQDGAELIRQSTERFDVLLVDGFDRTGQPPQLCSQAFYDDCYRALTADGIMVVNLLGDIPDMPAWLERIRLSFSGAFTVIDDHDSLNKIVFACKGKAAKMPDEFIRVAARRLDQMHPVDLPMTAQAILKQRSPLQPIDQN